LLFARRVLFRFRHRFNRLFEQQIRPGRTRRRYTQQKAQMAAQRAANLAAFDDDPAIAGASSNANGNNVCRSSKSIVWG
jgi:hypothetical protein